MIPDPPPPFDLDMSELLRANIGDLGRRAALAGIGNEFRESMVEILTHLRMRPREWGEPFRNLRGFQMTARLAVHRKLRVVYSVHERIPLVVLWSLEPTAGHPLAPPSNGH